MISKPTSAAALHKSVYKISSRAYREIVQYDKDIIGLCRKINAQQIDPSFDDFVPPFLHPKNIQLFTPMSQFVPLVYDHQAIPLTKEDIFNIGMILMQ